MTILLNPPVPSNGDDAPYVSKYPPRILCEIRGAAVTDAARIFDLATEQKGAMGVPCDRHFEAWEARGMPEDEDCGGMVDAIYNLAKRSLYDARTRLVEAIVIASEQAKKPADMGRSGFRWKSCSILEGDRLFVVAPDFERDDEDERYEFARAILIIVESGLMRSPESEV